MGGESLQREHSDHQAKHNNASSGPGPTHADTTKVRPPVEQARSIAQASRSSGAGAPGLAAPDKVDLGDRTVGGRAHYQDVLLFNTQDRDAYLDVRFEGSREIFLDRAPERLHPSREGVDPGAAIRLGFAPTARGRTHGSIVIRAAWQSAVHPPQELRIPVAAAAHEAGQPLVADEEAEEHAHAAKEAAEAEAASEMDRAHRATEARLDDPRLANKLPGTAANRQRFDEAQRRAGDALFDLFEDRRVGLHTAKDEAMKFHLHKTPHEEGLLETLAWAALDVATVGIVGALGKSLEAVFAKSVKVAEHSLPNGIRVGATEYSPSKAVVAFFTDSTKDVAKRAAKAGTSAVKSAGGDERDAITAPGQGTPTPTVDLDPGPSSDPLLAFFQTEEIGLIDQHRLKATDTALNARDALEPMLDHAPAQAIAAMREIATAIIGLKKTKDSAANQQAQSSATHWIRYVAQTSLGTVSGERARREGMRLPANATSSTNLSAVNVAASSLGKPGARAGLLDVFFLAELARPWMPVTIAGAKLDGVSQTTRKRLGRQTLRDAGVPVRASATAHATDAVVGIEVVRDEAGNLRYTDDSGAPGMPGHWFAAKIGEPAGGLDAEKRGARKLMEEEIMDTQLKVEIRGDSDA